MALGFSLLDDDTIYQEITTTLGSWVNREYVEATVSSVAPIAAIWESFSEGESTLILPEGLSSTDAITIFSETEFTTANDIAGNIANRTTIFLEDPAVVTNTQAFIIMDKAKWKKNTAMTLMSEYSEYMAIRREKVQ